VAALVEAERAIAHLQARQVRQIAAIADDPCADAVAPQLDRDWAKDELRAALGESAESVNNRIELARALLHRSSADDPRSRDQRRADGLVQLGIDALNGYARCPTCVVRDDTPQAGTGPRRLGLRPTIQVSVALSTLLGQDEQPGELAGYGPIPAHVARRLAADRTGTWRRLVTDELGRLRDYGRTRYRPPADLHDFVVARDQTCAFPTCHRQASRCELDHIDPWVRRRPDERRQPRRPVPATPPRQTRRRLATASAGRRQLGMDKPGRARCLLNPMPYGVGSPAQFLIRLGPPRQVQLSGAVAFHVQPRYERCCRSAWRSHESM
jgi:hypothetical protein